MYVISVGIKVSLNDEAFQGIISHVFHNAQSINARFISTFDQGKKDRCPPSLLCIYFAKYLVK